MSSRKLVIIYNADSTLRGKLNYALRKFSSKSSKDPACAACDITHGGLSLSEVPGWKAVKKEIEAQDWTVVQWHRDEVEEDVKSWAKEQEVRYPVVLSKYGAGTGGQTGETRVVCESSELAECAGDATLLLKKLRAKGLLDGSDKETRSAL